MNKIRTTREIATDETAEQRLLHCLAEVPFLKVQNIEQRLLSQTGRPEIIAKIKIENQERMILAEVKKNGQPRLIREAIASIRSYRETYLNAYGVVLVPRMTPAGMNICRTEGIGYLDLAGNCLLNFDYVFVQKTGRVAPAKSARKARSWYSPRAERVVRVLLQSPGRAWSLHNLAEEALVTPNQALAVKELLTRRGWLQRTAEGFVLTEPDLLLDNWAANYLPRRNLERLFYSDKSVIELEAILADVCAKQTIPYALMGFSAATRYTPFVHYDRIAAYVLTDLSKVIAAMDLTEVAHGANVTLCVPYDEGVLFGAHRSEWVRMTSPVQTYVDLINAGGHGERVANAIWQGHLNGEQPEKSPGPALQTADECVQG